MMRSRGMQKSLAAESLDSPRVKHGALDAYVEEISDLYDSMLEK